MLRLRTALQAAGTAAGHRSPPKAGAPPKRGHASFCCRHPIPTHPSSASSGCEHHTLPLHTPAASTARSRCTLHKPRCVLPASPLGAQRTPLHSPLPKYTIPYSRPCGVLYSTVKQTSFPISFFRRNSRAGNPQGWRERSRREPMGQTQPGKPRASPPWGTHALLHVCCISPGPRQRLFAAHELAEESTLLLCRRNTSTLPLRPPRKGVTAGFPAGLVLPKHSQTHPAEPRKAPGTEGAGLELRRRGGLQRGLLQLLPQAAWVPMAKEQSGTGRGGCAQPGEAGSRVPPAPPCAKAGIHRSPGELSPTPPQPSLFHPCTIPLPGLSPLPPTSAYLHP